MFNQEEVFEQEVSVSAETEHLCKRYVFQQETSACKVVSVGAEGMEAAKFHHFGTWFAH